VLQGISRNEAERWRLESEYKAELDMQSRLGGAKREGRQEGERIGEERGRREILELLRRGKSPEEIIGEFGDR